MKVTCLNITCIISRMENDGDTVYETDIVMLCLRINFMRFYEEHESWSAKQNKKRKRMYLFSCVSSSSLVSVAVYQLAISEQNGNYYSPVEFSKKLFVAQKKVKKNLLCKLNYLRCAWKSIIPSNQGQKISFSNCFEDVRQTWCWYNFQCLKLLNQT